MPSELKESSGTNLGWSLLFSQLSPVNYSISQSGPHKNYLGKSFPNFPKYLLFWTLFKDFSWKQHSQYATIRRISARSVDYFHKTLHCGRSPEKLLSVSRKNLRMASPMKFGFNKITNPITSELLKMFGNYLIPAFSSSPESLLLFSLSYAFFCKFCLWKNKQI